MHYSLIRGDVRPLKWLETMSEHQRCNQPPEVLEKGSRDSVDVRLMAVLPDGIQAHEEVLSLARRLAPGFYLDVGNVCNQYCLYCAVPRQQLYQTTMNQAQAQVAGAAGLGFKTAVFIGGEPTIWPHLSATLALMPDYGLSRAVLTTNGLMLAYPELLTRLTDRGVSTVGLSFDSFDPAVQIRLSRRQDYPAVINRALDNLATSRAHTYLYGVVTSDLVGQEHSFADQAVELARRFVVPPAFILAGLKPVEEGAHRFHGISVSMEQTAAAIKAITRHLDGAATVAYRDVPLCLMSGYLDRSLDLYHDNATVSLATGEQSEAGFKDRRIFADQCDRCSMQSRCPGLYAGYVDHFGSREFLPL